MEEIGKKLKAYINELIAKFGDEELHRKHLSTVL